MKKDEPKKDPAVTRPEPLKRNLLRVRSTVRAGAIMLRYGIRPPGPTKP
jgi:hypothetical protein